MRVVSIRRTGSSRTFSSDTFSSDTLSSGINSRRFDNDQRQSGRRRRSLRRIGLRYLVGLATIGVVGCLAAVPPPPTAAAYADNAGKAPVRTVVRKTVQQLAAPNGQVFSNTMYTQVSAVGNGLMKVAVPVGTNTIRNLNGFGSLPTTGNSVQFDLPVNGSTDQRVLTAADSRPIQVAVKTSLDGKLIDPDQVAEKTGLLEVEYTVTNTTSANTIAANMAGTADQPGPTDSEADSEADSAAATSVANPAVETQRKAQDKYPDQVVPFVGTLSITLPEDFADISAPGAYIAGNGQNGNLLSYSMVLFAPIGSKTTTLKYKSQIVNGTLPAAVFNFLPIVPFDSDTISMAKDSYAEAMRTGSRIEAAGVGIGDNLLKLQAGITTLMNGLVRAALGASELSSKLGDGLQPAKELAKGSEKLSTGLNNPDPSKGAAAGAAALAAGISGKDPKKGLFGGALAVQAGLKRLRKAVAELDRNPAVAAALAEADKALRGLKTYTELIGAAAADISSTAGQLATFGAAGGSDCPAACQAKIGDQGSGWVQDLGDDSGSINAIINDGIFGNPGMNQIISLLLAGLPGLIPILEQGLLGDPSSPGIEALAEGSSKLVSGVEAAGAGAAALAAGVAAAADGAALIAAGTKTLPDSLAQAEEGAGQLAKGLSGEAVTGTSQAIVGVDAIKTEGADEVAAKGRQAHDDYQAKVDQLLAAQAAGAEGLGIPYGKAQGEATTTTAAYQVTLRAATDLSRENAYSYLLALVLLLGSGVGGLLLSRRRKTVRV